MNSFFYKSFISILIVLLPFISSAQEIGSQQALPKTKTERRMEKKKWQKERKLKFAEEKKLKNHRKIQTKAVQKRMKKNKKKSERINENKREFFLQRWFSRK